MRLFTHLSNSTHTHRPNTETDPQILMCLPRYFRTHPSAPEKIKIVGGIAIPLWRSPGFYPRGSFLNGAKKTPEKSVVDCVNVGERLTLLRKPMYALRYFAFALLIAYQPPHAFTSSTTNSLALPSS